MVIDINLLREWRQRVCRVCPMPGVTPNPWRLIRVGAMTSLAGASPNGKGCSRRDQAFGGSLPS